MISQKTLLDDYPQDRVRTHYGYAEEHDTKPRMEKEPLQQLIERRSGQKARILQLLKEMDRVPVDMLKGQYNARINELNKDLAVQRISMQIVSEYDPETQQYYKRLELVNNE